MTKSVVRFSVIRLILSVVNFFSIGGVLLFFLTEGTVHVPFLVVYMLLNIAVFSLVWAFLLNVPPREAGGTARSDLLTLHIPTILYSVLTLVLLAADLAFGDVAATAFVTIKYIYAVACPLGINTIAAISMADSIDSYVYYLSIFLHLAIYATVITVVYKSDIKRQAKKAEI